jgi:DNA-binding IclR family transcriptional regulator
MKITSIADKLPAKPFHDTDEANAAETSRVDGTQAIRRAAAVLRRIASAGVEGTALAEIARALGLPRSTVHRIVKCLQEEGFVEPGEGGRRWQIGEMIQELALAPGSRSKDIARWRSLLDSVARRTGVTTYLMGRSGVESVCLAKVDGHSMVRFVPVEVGRRRLLGVGAGATALLAALEPARVEDVIRSIAGDLGRWPRITPQSLRDGVTLVHRTGFALSQGAVVADGFGLGCILPASAPGAVPHLALSIAAHAGTVTESSIATWKKVFSEEIQRATAAA